MRSQDVVKHLHSYSAAEDTQGILKVTHTWKDAVQESIMVLSGIEMIIII
jgi:hypothetical protein